jgi:hypothetical protein
MFGSTFHPIKGPRILRAFDFFYRFFCDVRCFHLTPLIQQKAPTMAGAFA